MSATWAKPSVRSRWRAAVGENGASGSSPSTRPSLQVGGPGRAEHDGAVLGGADQQPADVRVGAERPDQVGMALVDLLEGEPAIALHQVDEAEVAGPEDHHVAVRDVVLRALARLAAGRLVDGVPHHRVLLVAAGDARHLAARQRSLDELVEPVAVALLERRALGLAVIGEHDDLVRPRGVAARAGDAAELLVELAQRLQRVRALEAGVVRDLVVARERRVDRGAAAHHVGQHAEDDQVAHDHAHRRRA